MDGRTDYRGHSKKTNLTTNEKQWEIGESHDQPPPEGTWHIEDQSTFQYVYMPQLWLIQLAKLFYFLFYFLFLFLIIVVVVVVSNVFCI